MSDKEEELDVEIFIKEKEIYCWACGDELKRSSLLVCAECLSDECTKFAERAKQAKNPSKK